MQNELNLFDIAIILLKKKKTILINFVFICIVAFVIGIMLDPWFKSTVTFIPKGSGGGAGLFAMIGEQMSADLVGDLPFSKRQYLTILNSGKIRGEMIEKFNLIEHYEIEGKHLVHRAGKMLNSRISVEVEEEGGLGITDVLSIKISILDKDKQLAADMANYMFDRMEEIALELHHSSYTNLGDYLSDQLNSYDDSLAVAQKALSDFMVEHKVYSIDKQKAMVLEAYGHQKAQIIALDTRLSVLKKEYSNSNPQVKALKKEKSALLSNLKDMETSVKKDVFVGLENSINLSEQYAELFLSVEVYGKLKQILLQQLKQARIKGDRDFSGVYLLERAMPALYKAKPKRAFVILGIVFVYMTFLVLAILVVSIFNLIGTSDCNLENKITELKNAFVKM